MNYGAGGGAFEFLFTQSRAPVPSDAGVFNSFTSIFLDSIDSMIALT